jgi:hypothetical protein
MSKASPIKIKASAAVSKGTEPMAKVDKGSGVLLGMNFSFSFSLPKGFSLFRPKKKAGPGKELSADRG